MDRKIDRRLLMKGLFGVAGAGALAVILPQQAEALPGLPPNDLPSPANDFPQLDKFTDALDGGDDAPVLGEGVELASHRRRRRRRWRWRNSCRRYWNGFRYRNRCRRRRVWFWIWA